jgi:hypothetical protein
MIDDALFLKVAAQILREPLQPFAVDVNWYGWNEPLWGVFKNPPGLSYWLAGVQALGGRSETLWHLSLLPFSIAAAVAGVRLAQRFTVSPAWTTAAWVASPAFLVSASTLMADVPSLAFTLWGLVLWLDGIDGDSARQRRLGALLTGVAMILKYTAALGVPTLLLYAALRASPRRWRRQVLDVWPAVLPAAAWALVSLAGAGRIHLIDSLLLRGGGLDPNPGWFAHRAIALLTFVAGAGVFPLVFTATLVTSPRGRWLTALGGAIGVAAGVATPLIWSPRGLLPGAVPFVAVLAGVGACALLSTAKHAWMAAAGDRDAVFLAACVGLHVAFLWLWSWTVAARFVLPMLVPLALLLGRMLESRSRETRRLLLGSAALVAFVLSCALLRADRAPGDFHRRVVADISAQARGEHRPAQFVGAWGFAYYAEQAGMAHLDVRARLVAPGELVLQPYFVANNELPPSLVPRLAQVASIPAPAPMLGLQTMNMHAGAGFYSSVYGPLPFVRAALPADGLVVWLVRGP